LQEQPVQGIVKHLEKNNSSQYVPIALYSLLIGTILYSSDPSQNFFRVIIGTVFMVVWTFAAGFACGFIFIKVFCEIFFEKSKLDQFFEKHMMLTSTACGFVLFLLTFTIGDK